MYLVLSMVYGGGALLHAVYFEADVEESEVPRARKFKLEWENPDNQTFIHCIAFLLIQYVFCALYLFCIKYDFPCIFFHCDCSPLYLFPIVSLHLWSRLGKLLHKLFIRFILYDVKLFNT